MQLKTYFVVILYVHLYFLFNLFCPQIRVNLGADHLTFEGVGWRFMVCKIFFSSNLVGRIFFYSSARIFFYYICAACNFFLPTSACRKFFFKITHPPPPQELNGRPLIELQFRVRKCCSSMTIKKYIRFSQSKQSRHNCSNLSQEDKFYLQKTLGYVLVLQASTADKMNVM